MLQAERDVTTPTMDTDSEKPGVPEWSVWGHYAAEDVGLALKRLAMVAKDMHKLDPTKSVKQHYNERLLVLLQQGEIEFDCSDSH